MNPCLGTTIVRFNGGPQAGHNCMTPDGRQHKFSHFGSGMLLPNIRTHLSRFMVCSPWNMIVEEKKLALLGVTDAFERTTMSEECLVITPYHSIANRLRERVRGANRHGSCGIGIGETMKDSLELPEEFVVRLRDFKDRVSLEKKLECVRLYKLEQLRREGIMDIVRHQREAFDEIDELVSPVSSRVAIQILGEFFDRMQIVPDCYLKDILDATNEVWLLTDLGFGDQGKGTTVETLCLQRSHAVIFEPAQGVLLDEWRGFHPHTTWSTCTFDNVHSLLQEHEFKGRVYHLGILRAYATRHGAGPFVTEDTDFGRRLPELWGCNSVWTGDFRVGHFDAVSARYAIECCGGAEVFDGLVITCLDRLEGEDWQMCTAYDTSDISDPDSFFDGGDGQVVTQIKLGPFKDLTYQEELTHRLFKVNPVYESTRCALRHLERISEELDLPVVLTSWGPTYQDKQWEMELINFRKAA